MTHIDDTTNRRFDTATPTMIGTSSRWATVQKNWRTTLLALVVYASVAGQAAVAQPTSNATWKGGAGQWSAPEAWNISRSDPAAPGNAIPCGSPSEVFEVTIGDDAAVQLDVVSCEVNRLQVGHSGLELGPNSNLTVSEFAGFAGEIVGSGGSLVTPNLAEGTILGDLVTVQAIDGSDISLGADRYAPLGHRFGGTVLQAMGAGSTIRPVDAEDRLMIETSGSQSTIELPQVRVIRSGNGGTIGVAATGPSKIALGDLESVGHTWMRASNGGQIVGSGNGNGVYDSKRFQFGGEVIAAHGAGSVVALPSIGALDMGFASNHGNEHKQTITATAGGQADLPAVETILGPVDSEDSVIISANDGTINLPRLHSIRTAGAGAVGITAEGQSTITLGSVTDATNTWLAASNGGQIVGGAGNSGTFDSRKWSFGGEIVVSNGTGSLISLPSLSTFNAGFASNHGNQHVQSLTAGASGRISLPGLQSVIAPRDAEDQLVFQADSGRIDVPGLQTIRTAGRGSFAMTVVGIGNADIGRFAPHAASSLAVSDAATVSIKDDLILHEQAIPSSVRVENTLNVDGDVYVGDAATFHSGGTLNLGGDLRFRSTREADLDLSSSIVQFQGADAPQILEVGGQDAGTNAASLGTNFSIGELVIGTSSQSTTVHLMDLANNGNRTSPEALYINIASGPTSRGLRILNGSTLVLNDIHVYLARRDGELLDLDTLIPSGPGPHPFDEGFIVRSQSGEPGDVDFSGGIDCADIDLLSEAIAGVNSDGTVAHDFLDLTGNGSINEADRLALIEDIIGTSLGDADLDGDVDFSDFATLAENFDTFNGWCHGDFDGNGHVGFVDFRSIADNFGQTSQQVAAVPEPSSADLCLVAVLAAAVAFVAQTRRKRNRTG